jgi:hypothetical protein
MTSPPRRPIISLKFKKPELESGEPSQPAPAKPAALLPPAPPPARHKTEFFFKPASPKTAPIRDPFAKTPAPKPKAQPAEKLRPAPATDSDAADARQRPRKGPAISPEVFKAAIRSAGIAIQNVVADPEWKSEELLHQYQSAKEHATSTHKQQAKLVSTVATRRHSRDIEHADVENAAMRAAYAAALVALVEAADKNASGETGKDTAGSADEGPDAEA